MGRANNPSFSTGMTSPFQASAFQSGWMSQNNLFVIISHSYMPVTSRNLISPGVNVSIALKADQRTGRHVQGIVADVLTRRDHPRGIKVRLRDGQIGRVHGLIASTSIPPQSQATYSYRTSQTNRRVKMSSNNNPWEDQASPARTNPFEQLPASERNNPWGEQQPLQSQGQPQDQSQSANYYEAPPNPPPSHQHQQYQEQQQQPQSFQAPNRTPTQNEQYLPQGQERSEQVETMQNYESRAPQSQEDKDQAQLQKEFPSVDGSLIAALYGDSKNLAETREMLEELARGA